MPVFSAGLCPVCFETGAVVILASRTTSALVYWCPACDCAWPEPPGDRIDSFAMLADLAPEGVRLPNEEELRASGTCVEINPRAWEPLEDLLAAMGPA